MNFHVTRQAAVSSLALAMAAPCAFADTTPVDTVAVTATRIPQHAPDVIAQTTVVDAAQIARSGAGSVADVLQRQPGIEIARNGSAGAATSVYLRGANSNQVVVLLDGVRIGSSTSGAASWNAVPLEAIERIEIVYGPLSTLYGADAIGGVIQIFTRKGEGAGTAASASLGAGSDATRQASAHVSGAAGALRYAFGAGHEQSDGYSATEPGAFGFNPDDDGYRRSSANGRLAMALAPGHEIGAQVLHSRMRAQYDSGAGSFDTRNRQELNTAALFMTNQILPHWRSTLQLARAEDKLGSFANASASGASQIDTRQDDLSWQNTVTLGASTLQLLYGHRKEAVESSSSAALGRERITNAYAAAYALLEGVTLSGATRLGALRLHGSADWLDARDTGKSSGGSNNGGKRLARRAREHASVGADYRIGRLETGAEWQVSGARFDDAANLRRLGGYGLLNLYASWRLSADLSLLARVNNAADKDYELARNYGTGGRSWFAGLRYGIR